MKGKGRTNLCLLLLLPQKTTSPKKVGSLYLLPPINHCGEWAHFIYYKYTLLLAHVWSTFVAQEWVSAYFWMFLTFRIICSVGTAQHVPSASGKVVKCYSVVVARHETLGGSSRWLRPKSLLHVLHELCDECALTSLQFLDDLLFDAADSVPVVWW